MLGRKYSGYVGGITPATTDDNWTVEGAQGEFGRIIEVSWGGEATTSTAMRTRVQRSASQAGAGTAGDITELGQPAGGAPLLAFFTTYATTQPTLDAGALFGTSWNAHGGVIRWLADPGEGFWIVGTAGTPAADQTISCRNDVGTATSSYACVWEE